MRDYAQVKQYNMDQIWLGQFVWPMLMSDCLQHGYRELKWMEESRTMDEHMGRGYTVDEMPRQDHGG
jgi:hypothetical protein